MVAFASFALASAEENIVTTSSATEVAPVKAELIKKPLSEKQKQEIKERDLKKIIKNNPEVEAQIKALNLEMETKIRALREEYALKIKAIVASASSTVSTTSRMFRADMPGKREGMDEGRKLGVPFMMASTTASGTPVRPMMKIKDERNEDQERVDKKFFNFFRGFFGN